MKKILQKLLATLLTVTLISCGSNQPDTVETKLSTGIATTTKSTDFGKAASAQDIAAMSAKLGSYFNGQYANDPKALMGEQAKAITTKSASPMIAASNVASAVFRFYNTKTGAHFFTMSAAESDYVKTTFPFFNFEGNSFLAYPDADASLSPVHRFYNNVTGTHFFTISAEEKAYVQATWPEIFNYEGISWHASADVRTGWVPVYRFFNTKTSTHFYTTSAAERDYVKATWSWFTFEGIAYYVLESAPVDPVVPVVPGPSIGITYTSQTAVAGDAASVALYNQQGANGYAYVGPYIFSMGTLTVPVYDIKELFVKAQANTTYQYKAITEPAEPVGWLAMLNTEGAYGYLYKTSQYFNGTSISAPTTAASALFVKSSARNTTYSYRLVADSQTLAALNSNGADGYAFRGGYVFGGVICSLYVKDNSSGATFSYLTMPLLTTATALVAEMNTLGAQMYTPLGAFSMSGVSRTIYEKNSTNSTSTQFTFDPVFTSFTQTNQQMLDKLNAYAATGYLYMSDSYIGGGAISFFSKGATVTNPLIGPVFP